ncbi:phage integrase Arm DNA-binding domain-containing protein [Thalassolituus sp.]|uniref:phage integrase Arm DNA-binding domain-containing protein n=1 Tax=Thalassolituus sp. TaxID=2030822 RepID=UPI002617A399|nr:phage integrase Arm DNA-binding domain-containing protein [Thalassolituus sp.]
MAPRARKHKGLEANVYPNKSGGHTYYRYKHPITGVMHPLGKNKAEANTAARILNAKLLQDDACVVDRIMGTVGISMAALVERFRDDRLPEMGLKVSTLKLMGYRLNRIVADLGDRVITEMTTKDCATWLDDNFESDPYVKHRGTLIELFRYAENKGLRNGNDNPAEGTYPNRKKKKKARKRMTVEQYLAIHAAAPDWMKIAMELALITLQGRSELIRMRYDAIKDCYLYVVRQKVESHEHARLRIKVTPEIESIVSRSRDGLASPYIVHRRPQRVKENKDTDHWTQIAPNEFTKQFRLIRDSLPEFIGIPKEERGGIHEVRALGSWLYEQAGYERDYVQHLMAHSDEKMTEYYQSEHEEKWIDVKAELSLASVFK